MISILHGTPVGAEARGAEACGFPRQRRARAAGLRLFCGAVALHTLCSFWQFSRYFEIPAAAFATSPVERSSAQRRQLLIASSLGLGSVLLDSKPASAVFDMKFKTNETQLVAVPENFKPGLRAYEFEKPAGFKRYGNAIDPTGLVFRKPDNSYYTFITRAEKRENATEFTPQIFIDDYRQKFVNASGSSFNLIKGSSEPDRVERDVKYYEVEYVVRTQLGFGFDSLKSLHFLTTFAATPESIYVLNCQALDDDWEKAAPTLRKVASTFKVTS
mmetsp:Transcript_144950/g.377186  ORF Transcript_144950/g.377186 Transcript_144950/m.377186 type:complete len:273 (-) Transcript_144950:278-1096(-)